MEFEKSPKNLENSWNLKKFDFLGYPVSLPQPLLYDLSLDLESPISRAPNLAGGI